MTKERHMVTIETERTGTITLTPEQFDLMLTASLIHIESFYLGKNTKDANLLHDVLTAALDAHAD